VGYRFLINIELDFLQVADRRADWKLLVMSQTSTTPSSGTCTGTEIRRSAEVGFGGLYRHGGVRKGNRAPMKLFRTSTL
jgi:hypothetical protein